jgi:hypothetical protein
MYNNTRKELRNMLKNEYIEKLCDCQSNSIDCPYYDWRYQKCNMLAKEGCHPKDECDDYIGDDEE